MEASWPPFFVFTATLHINNTMNTHNHAYTPFGVRLWSDIDMTVGTAGFVVGRLVYTYMTIHRVTNDS